MKVSRKFILLFSLALLLSTQHVWGQKPPSVPLPQAVPLPPNMTLTTRLDRTAVWVGDQFHYMIMVEYPVDYEFVLDNLTKETVNMDPFQVVDVTKNIVIQKNNGRKL